MTKRLVTIGDLVVDLLLDVDLPVMPARHQTARSLRFEAGGACTTILAARQLGLAVAALGAVGEDLPGQFLLQILREAAVDISAVQARRGTTTTVVALADPGGQHVFLGHYGSGPAIGSSPRADELLAQADAVFLPGYSLLDPRLSQLVSSLLERQAIAGPRLYLDVGPFLGGLAPGRARAMLQAADTLLLTEDEVPFVAAGAAGIQACRSLLDAHPQLTIVLKRGAAGCHIMSRRVDAFCPGFPVELVDTIGAGDAFAAAYIWADLQGYSSADCGTIGNAMGAASVMKRGAGSNVPTRAQVQLVLDEHETGIKLIC